MADFIVVRQLSGTRSPVRHAGFYRCLLNCPAPEVREAFRILNGVSPPNLSLPYFKRYDAFCQLISAVVNFCGRVVEGV
jgi:hypothetical protein